MKVNVGGTLKPVVAAKINVGGTLKTIVRAKQNVGGSLKTGDSFYVALTASASPTSVSGSSFNVNPIYTGTATVTPSGGVAPYTYSWTRISGAGNITSPTSASTTFYDSLAEGDTSTGTFRCTVTDSHSATATADVTATFRNFGPFGA